MFQPPRDRDAYASIRGYVYQIDRTVARWLELGADQILELERGEDIDLVSLFATDGTALETRLLEQIKHRETSVTLRTGAAVEALANFQDHRRNNVGVDLRFCFLTNAVVGCERLNSFPGGVPGIAFWEQVRIGQLPDAELSVATDSLRRFLANATQPEGLNDAVWKSWKEFLKSATREEFGAFIEKFEWITGQPDSERLPLELRDRILALGLASDAAHAEAVYDRFFLYVTRVLCASGLKRLTADDRDRVREVPLLIADRELLVRIRDIVTEHSDRLVRLEADFASLGGRVEAVFFSGTVNGRVELSGLTESLTPPTSVARLSPRRQTVASLCRELETSAWVAFHGGPDTGKTQLAVLASDALGGCRCWVRFHHAQPTSESLRCLDNTISVLVGGRGGYEAITTVIGAKSLIVLDDLPRIPSDDPFTERLIRLGQAVRSAGGRVISTSQHALPTRLRHQFGDAWLVDRLASSFTDEEALELFLAFGAPPGFLSEKMLRFLNGHAAGHPLLLAATAEFLAGRGWAYRDDEIDALLRGDHTHAIMPEVVDRLTRTLGDAPREFLYRLTLILGPFKRSDMLVLANVSPAVQRPRERLNELLGAWVQRDSDTQYVVSPLAKPLGSSELAPDLVANCYRELAGVITRREVMGPVEGDRAICYNLRAGESGRAITLYVLFLVEALRSGRVDHIVRFIDKWRSTPLPADLDVGTKLFVRAYQLAVFTKYELDRRFLVHNIDELLSKATDKDGLSSDDFGECIGESVESAIEAVDLGGERRAGSLRFRHRHLVSPSIGSRFVKGAFADGECIPVTYSDAKWSKI